MKKIIMIVLCVLMPAIVLIHFDIKSIHLPTLLLGNLCPKPFVIYARLMFFDGFRLVK